ncbi:ABC transporter ATP-binding protein [Aestuariivirga litoralis]|uniref:ABC transporter ATP-binding protein n=1 Tax=Aestuariivirga litoralis TaxID=2650924 RepID=UPI0018C7373E|nr:ABC transporter ATP-binding protein [Aestuariivirga litoralis]MBG1232629.1 ABC transporter ATP-binding protein [Aestuariivirga litoralis]
MTELLAAKNIVKVFGTLRANDNVSLSLKSGKIHALLGENGAGKSTLVKMIYGALQPTSGHFEWMGKPVTIASPSEARALGVGMVFQHFSLFEALTAAENIALAMPGKFDVSTLSARVKKLSSEYGLPVDPASTIADLSVGQRQRVEIVRCLLQNPKLLILDEPTSVLTPQEAEQLFVTLRRLASEGCAILYISHRLEEVRKLCDTATVMRQGKVVAACVPKNETPASMARMMVGSDVAAVHAHSAPPKGPVRLHLDHLCTEADGFEVALRDVSLEVQGGELVAIAGVAGNGQSEFFDALSGELSAKKAGQVIIDGAACGFENVTQRRRRGAAFVPEERLGHAAVPGFALSDNAVLTLHSVDGKLSKNGVLRKSEALAMAAQVIKTYDVRKGKVDPEARSLSGGNLQKFTVGRELERKPGILVVNQPTWGVDAGAAATIRQALIDLARSGSAVLVISQDLDEIFEIADRIAVISRGQLSKAGPRSDWTLENIGLAMAGAHEVTDAA